MAANGMTPCQPRKKARTTIQAADLPGRPDRLRRNVTADAPAVRRVGDTTLHPDLARIRLPGHGHGAASGKKIIGHAMTGHMRTGLTGEAPTRGHQGPPTGPGRHGVSFRYQRDPEERTREPQGLPDQDSRDPGRGILDRTEIWLT